MTTRLLPVFVGLVMASCASHVDHIAVQPTAPNAASAERGMVATVHPLATQAGVNVLKNGGNAIDAAVAVALTLGVVDGHNSGLGGGCFMLIRRADGSLVALDGRETAPAAATRDMFVRNGKADPDLSQTGALAIGVPGALAVYEHAMRHFGKRTLRELILPAAGIAESGFVLNQHYAGQIRAEARELARFEAARALLFNASGEPFKEGDTLRQPGLAETYRRIAEEGSGWFYRGPFAQAVERWMKNNGGVLTAADLANYQLRIREPIRTGYRGYEIISFPPPSSGGVHVAQILNILDHFDLKSMSAARRAHVMAEAMKLAFADRAYWLGDPDFSPVPRGLVDKRYAAQLAGRIRLNQTIRVASRGEPPGWRENLFEKHTTHFSVADAEGNWVACTATINTSFGSKVVIPGTGVIMNNEMDDFSAQPGAPNAFGLIGAEANAVAAGKRPLSSMSPTLVLKSGEPMLALGAAGGPTIISQVAQHLVSVLDLGMDPVAALTAPRLHHQWFPDELRVERSLPAEIQSELRARGHTVRLVGLIGVSQMVMRAADGPGFIGVADPRIAGQAAGW